MIIINVLVSSINGTGETMDILKPNDSKDIRSRAVDNLEFLLSMIRSGETLLEDEESNVRKVIEKLKESAANDAKLTEVIVDARKDLADRDQEIFILNSRLRVLGESFDELATAVGWTKERCDLYGISPMDMARELLRDVATQKIELIHARAELNVAVRKIADLTPSGPDIEVA
jgi:hypothetical protein